MSEYQTDRMSIDIFKINWCINYCKHLLLDFLVRM